VLERLELHNQNVCVHYNNLFLTCTDHRVPWTLGKPKLLKITKSEVSPSVPHKGVEKMLTQLAASLRNPTEFEKIRIPFNRQLTTVSNGKIIVYISPLPEKKSFLRNPTALATCANFTILHYLQGHTKNT
jgi:hypothetical protein